MLALYMLQYKQEVAAERKRALNLNFVGTSSIKSTKCVYVILSVTFSKNVLELTMLVCTLCYKILWILVCGNPPHEVDPSETNVCKS